jgi:hypothetical protein
LKLALCPEQGLKSLVFRLNHAFLEVLQRWRDNQMMARYQHLGIFSDWVEAARNQSELYPVAPPGAQTQRRVKEVLGFCGGPESPLNVQVGECWEKDGLRGEAISWSVGYGPRTQAWVLKPAQANAPLPGVIALHDHGGFKFAGKEKIAEGPADPPSYILDWWAGAYGERPFANALAKEGFVVLVPDTFLWGSRRFPEDIMPAWTREAFDCIQSPEGAGEGIPDEIGRYNFSAAQHEHLIEKYCNVLGTTLAGVISHEDRIAANYLRSRQDVVAGAALLQATYDPLKAAVVVGLMSTYAHLLDRHMIHSWMCFPSGWAKYGDWPDLAACRAPSPLLVQYDTEDNLFTMDGMQAAHERLTAHYQSVGQPAAYTGEFYPGPHKFDLEMQRSAFAWLKKWLRPDADSR